MMKKTKQKQKQQQQQQQQVKPKAHIRWNIVTTLDSLIRLHSNHCYFVFFFPQVLQVKIVFQVRTHNVTLDNLYSYLQGALHCPL